MDDEPCRVGIKGICVSPRQATRHHRHKREHGGHKIFPGAKLLVVCSPCHRYVHQHEEWAVSWGLLVPPGIHPKHVEPIFAPVRGVPGPVTFTDQELAAGLRRVASYYRPGHQEAIRGLSKKQRQRYWRQRSRDEKAQQALVEPWSPKPYSNHVYQGRQG